MLSISSNNVFFTFLVKWRASFGPSLQILFFFTLLLDHFQPHQPRQLDGLPLFISSCLIQRLMCLVAILRIATLSTIRAVSTSRTSTFITFLTFSNAVFRNAPSSLCLSTFSISSAPSSIRTVSGPSRLSGLVEFGSNRTVPGLAVLCLDSDRPENPGGLRLGH